MKTPTLVAIDLGAESCRVSLLQWQNRDSDIRIVHRFPNSPQNENGHLRWDIGKLYAQIEHGLRLCANLSNNIAAVGVDGWAVDYVRFGADGNIIRNPFCYRDERTVDAAEKVHERISRERLYGLTGIQFLRINTLYQLYADTFDNIDRRAPWLNLPEYVSHRLGGKPASEYTNATHSELVELRTRSWCPEIFSAAQLDLNAAPKIVSTGSSLGQINSSFAHLPAFRETQIIAPACHDTASAVAGIPAEGDDWGFISSGTWSLVGTVLESPCTSAEAREKNFTNLGAVGGRTCFLKNVNGMWLLRQCIETWKAKGRDLSVEELIQACSELSAPEHLIDVDDPNLLLPGDMPACINAQLARTGRPEFPDSSRGAVAMANTILHSLARRYADVLGDIRSITGKHMRRLYIVGGGSRNTLLNKLTQERTGLEVVLGSSESSTIGNFAVQLASLSGACTESEGVAYSCVTRWADELAAHPFAVGADQRSR